MIRLLLVPYGSESRAESVHLPRITSLNANEYKIAALGHVP